MARVKLEQSQRKGVRQCKQFIKLALLQAAEVDETDLRTMLEKQFGPVQVAIALTELQADSTILIEE